MLEALNRRPTLFGRVLATLRFLIHGYAAAPLVDYAWIKDPILEKGIAKLKAICPIEQTCLTITRDNIDQWCDDKFFQNNSPSSRVPSKQQRWTMLNRWLAFGTNSQISIDTNSNWEMNRHIHIAIGWEGDAIVFHFKNVGPSLGPEQFIANHDS